MQIARTLLELVTSCDSCSFPPSQELLYLTISSPKMLLNPANPSRRLAQLLIDSVGWINYMHV